MNIQEAQEVQLEKSRTRFRVARENMEEERLRRIHRCLGARIRTLGRGAMSQGIDDALAVGLSRMAGVPIRL